MEGRTGTCVFQLERKLLACLIAVIRVYDLHCNHALNNSNLDGERLSDRERRILNSLLSGIPTLLPLYFLPRDND